jgi:hypothetical protein
MKVVAAPVYEKAVEQFQRDNPQLKKLFINKKGQVKIEFSKPIKFPESWKENLKKDRLLR